MAGKFLEDRFIYYHARDNWWYDIPSEDTCVNQKIGIQICYQNDDTVTRDITIFLDIYNPNGIKIAEMPPVRVDIPAGAIRLKELTTTKTTLLGEYTAWARLVDYRGTSEESIITDWEGKVATVIGEEVTGKFFPGSFLYLGLTADGEPDWQSSPGEDLPVGAFVGIATLAKNTGASTEEFHSETSIFDPNGKKIVTKSKDATLKVMTQSISLECSTNNTKVLGKYTAKCKLTCEGELLDDWEGEIGEVTQLPSDYKLIQHTVYPEADTYYGDAEECTIEFKLTPEQVPGTQWLGKKVADAFANEVEKQHATMLDLKIYEDTSPILWTNYRIVATTTASPHVIVAVVVYAILAILFVVAIAFAIREYRYVKWGKPPYGNISVSAVDSKTRGALIVPFQIDSTSGKTPWGPEKYLAGVYTVTWGSKTGYLLPDPSSSIATVVKDQQVTVTGEYWPESAGPRPTTCEVLITSSPSGVIVHVDTMSGKTPWSLILEKGNYTVTFDNISGYETPAPISFTVLAGGQMTVSGIYRAIDGIPWKWIGIGAAAILVTVLAIKFIPTKPKSK